MRAFSPPFIGVLISRLNGGSRRWANDLNEVEDGMSGQGFKTMGRWVRQHQDGRNTASSGSAISYYWKSYWAFFVIFIISGLFLFFIKR